MMWLKLMAENIFFKVDHHPPQDFDAKGDTCMQHAAKWKQKYLF